MTYTWIGGCLSASLSSKQMARTDYERGERAPFEYNFKEGHSKAAEISPATEKKNCRIVQPFFLDVENDKLNLYNFSYYATRLLKIKYNVVF